MIIDILIVSIVLRKMYYGIKKKNEEFNDCNTIILYIIAIKLKKFLTIIGKKKIQYLLQIKKIIDNMMKIELLYNIKQQKNKWY